MDLLMPFPIKKGILMINFPLNHLGHIATNVASCFSNDPFQYDSSQDPLVSNERTGRSRRPSSALVNSCEHAEHSRLLQCLLAETGSLITSEQQIKQPLQESNISLLLVADQ